MPELLLLYYNRDCTLSKYERIYIYTYIFYTVIIIARARALNIFKHSLLDKRINQNVYVAKHTHAALLIHD